MQRIRPYLHYQLQVVKEGEEPTWSGAEGDLLVGNKDLGSGFTQYWAYEKDADRDVDDIPPAEELAVKNNSQTPAIIINQQSDQDELVDLILVKDGHAWAKSEANFANLEANIESMVAKAKQEYDFEVEHFMTTGQVSPVVEKKLDHLEDTPEATLDSEAQEADDESKSYEQELGNLPPAEIRASGSIGLGGGSSNQIRMGGDNQFPSSGVYVSSFKSSKIWTIILVLVLVGLIGGVVYFREKIFSKLGMQIPGLSSEKTAEVAQTLTPTPTIALSPTPTPISLDRSKYQVRVLNGTSTSGAAATLADKLKTLGWKVPVTGNADSSDVSQTKVRVKKDMNDLAKALVDDLAKDYEASSSMDLEKTSKYDAEVVIGKK